MKTYLQTNESKSTLAAFPRSHSLTHSLTHLFPRTVFFHAVHNTEGILRGLCNKEHTKQFRYGCGMNVSTHAY